MRYFQIQSQTSTVLFLLGHTTNAVHTSKRPLSQKRVCPSGDDASPMHVVDFVSPGAGGPTTTIFLPATPGRLRRRFFYRLPQPVLRSGSRYIARLLGRHMTHDAARSHGQRRSRQTMHQNSGILAFHAPSVGLLSKHVMQDIEGLAECAHI